MSGLISLSANKASSGLKVNVVNISHINLNKNGQHTMSSQANKKQTNSTSPTYPTIREEESIIPVVYASTTTTDEVAEDTTTTDTSSEQITKLNNEISALKLIINILQNNPFYVNKFVVADDTVLMEVIKLLTNADDIVMDAEDIGEGCITKKSYRKVNAIYVIKDGETKNLKYSYPSIVQELTELHISFKFV